LLVEPEHPEISVRRQCDFLVNRSGLYYQSTGESEENLKLMRLMDEEYTRHPFLGAGVWPPGCAAKGTR
jgi:putative transposase